MPQPLPGPLPPSGPTFYITVRQPLSPAALLLAIVAAVLALAAVLFALRQAAPHHRVSSAQDAARSTAAGAPASSANDDKDDPSQIDTIVLGDPADAPVPARRGDHVSPVHPTIIVRLPRFGDQVGLIPNTSSGRLLYAWLAAFNQANAAALQAALPTNDPPAVVSAELELRQRTGGFALLSATEAQPGVLVFRLRDQTRAAQEVLGTLQIRPNSSPPDVQSFSLRAVPSPAPTPPSTPQP